jgi:LmbE family N-acetylglucosaminyl deacetylase
LVIGFVSNHSSAMLIIGLLMKVNILAIHAHPDDLEILAGGTLTHLSRQGHAITLVTMTPGDCGTAEYDAETIADIRRNEAKSASLVLGGKYICAEFRDLAIFNDDASRRRVTELMRQTRPDIVITASPVDYHCDHEATSVLVRDACFGAPAPNYKTGSAPVLPKIPHLYFLDPDEGRDRDGRVVAPEFVADVSAYMEPKKRALECHESQREWLRKHHGMDNYIETMEEWTRDRGRLAGVTHGEGFRQYRCHPYPQSPLLQELLGPLAKNTSAA